MRSESNYAAHNLLLNALADEDSEVTLAAIGALTETRDYSFVAALTRLQQSHSDHRVREEAQTAAQRLSWDES